MAPPQDDPPLVVNAAYISSYISTPAGNVTLLFQKDGSVVGTSVLRPDGTVTHVQYSVPLTATEALADIERLRPATAEPSLKGVATERSAPDPFPPWPSEDDMPELRGWIRGLASDCARAGLLRPDALGRHPPGVDRLLEMVDASPLPPGPVLRYAERMMSELGRHAVEDIRGVTQGAAEHAFWQAVVASMLWWRCHGKWPRVPQMDDAGALVSNGINVLRDVSHAWLIGVGVLPDDNPPYD